MPLQIRDTKTTPRERYWPYPAVGGGEIKENSWMNLKREVEMQYRANSQPIPSEQEIIQYVCENVSVPCYDGTQPFRNRFTDPPSMIARGLKSPNWPLVLQSFKLMAKDTDRGLGDIIERIVGPIGGDLYKAWHLKIFGKPCGCSDRQASLNEEFPL